MVSGVWVECKLFGCGASAPRVARPRVIGVAGGVSAREGGTHLGVVFFGRSHCVVCRVYVRVGVWGVSFMIVPRLWCECPLSGVCEGGGRVAGV